MAQYDLTPVLAKHLDRHLVFPLLEFLQSKVRGCCTGRRGEAEGRL